MKEIAKENELRLPVSAAFRRIHPWQDCTYCGEAFQMADRVLDRKCGITKGPVRSLSEHQVWCLKQKRLEAKENAERARQARMIGV